MLKEITTRNFLESENVTVDYLAKQFKKEKSRSCLDYSVSEPIGFKFSEERKHIISFSVLDFKTDFPLALKDISEELEYSKYILDLNESNWDEEGAIGITSELYLEVIKFVTSYSKYILSLGVVIDKPEVNPLINGSIDISWRAPKARLLVNFRVIDGKIIAKFYGDLYQNMTDKSGFINTESLDLALIEWMKQLKK